jgi:hypothetical protein
LKEAVQMAVEAHQIPEMLRIYISQDAISKISIGLFFLFSNLDCI